eukprot:4087721-Pleurochrysis_carterae.AAC.1
MAELFITSLHIPAYQQPYTCEIDIYINLQLSIASLQYVHVETCQFALSSAVTSNAADAPPRNAPSSAS